MYHVNREPHFKWEKNIFEGVFQTPEHETVQINVNVKMSLATLKQLLRAVSGSTKFRCVRYSTIFAKNSDKIGHFLRKNRTEAGFSSASFFAVSTIGF